VSARWLARVRRGAAAVAWLFAASGACTGAELRPNRQDALDFARADVLSASRGAPDLFARAERARADALAAEDEEERGEHAERARAWLAAALAETRRIELMRATSAAEARVVAAETRRAELERSRMAFERAAALEVAAASAREQLARALQRAEADGLGDGAPARGLDESRLQAAEVLRVRARIVLAAAVALALPAERASTVAAALAQRPVRRTPAQGLREARAALELAERALGEARALSAGPDAQERAALLELARERGLEPSETVRGVVFALPNALGGARLERDARIWLSRIGAVLRAHPHGPVQLEVVPDADSSAEARRAASARGARIATLLAAGTARERLSVRELSAGSNAALVLPAYAAAAAELAVPPEPQACLSPAHAAAR
jgi:hypothetical protein